MNQANLNLRQPDLNQRRIGPLTWMPGLLVGVLAWRAMRANPWLLGEGERQKLLHDQLRACGPEEGEGLHHLGKVEHLEVEDLHHLGEVEDLRPRHLEKVEAGFAQDVQDVEDLRIAFCSGQISSMLGPMKKMRKRMTMKKMIVCFHLPPHQKEMRGSKYLVLKLPHRPHSSPSDPCQPLLPCGVDDQQPEETPLAGQVNACEIFSRSAKFENVLPLASSSPASPPRAQAPPISTTTGVTSSPCFPSVSLAWAPSAAASHTLR